MTRTVAIFWIQPTPSFPEGAPQREEYQSDADHDLACQLYAAEWRVIFHCPGCKNPDCPEHGC